MVLALSYGEVTPGFELSCPFRKLLLAQCHDLVPEDLQLIDPELYRSGVQKVLDSDVTGWGLAFVLPEVAVPGDSGGNLHKRRRAEIELKPGGSQLDVTEDNKIEYTKLLAAAKLKGYAIGIEDQTAAFQQGMQTVLGSVPILHRFRSLVLPFALDRLVADSATICFDDWAQSTTYEPEGAKDSEQAKWFWAFLRQTDESTRSLVLEFATGVALSIRILLLSTMHDCDYDNMSCVQVVLECQLLDSLD